MKTHLYSITIAALLVLSGCHTIKEDPVNESTHSFYVGTYTHGESQGIYKYEMSPQGKVKQVGLAAKSEGPSFLARSADGNFLIAVNEIENDEGSGTVESYLISGDSLKLMNRQSSGGAHPCFVTMNETGAVLTANYTGGNIGYLQLGPQGRLSDLMDVQQHEGQGTTDRQQGPHAHSVWFHPVDGSVISVDLGTNELWFSSIESESQKLVPGEPAKLAMDPGDGPRHLTFHPNGKWVYVVNELSSTVTLVSRDEDGGYNKGPAISTLPEGYSEPNTCADIRISSDGKFVYASNRGHNSLAVLEVSDKDGTLTLRGNKGSGGNGPRNFSLSPDENFILVANQHSNNIVTLKRDKETGLLRYVSQADAPTPVCIVF